MKTPIIIIAALVAVLATAAHGAEKKPTPMDVVGGIVVYHKHCHKVTEATRNLAVLTARTMDPLQIEGGIAVLESFQKKHPDAFCKATKEWLGDLLVEE
jgi:hypothetical protein